MTEMQVEKTKTRIGWSHIATFSATVFLNGLFVFSWEGAPWFVWALFAGTVACLVVLVGMRAFNYEPPKPPSAALNMVASWFSKDGKLPWWLVALATVHFCAGYIIFTVSVLK